MSKESIKQFNEYVNEYGFFYNGKLSIEVNGNIIPVESAVKILGVLNRI